MCYGSQAKDKMNGGKYSEFNLSLSGCSNRNAARKLIMASVFLRSLHLAWLDLRPSKMSWALKMLKYEKGERIGHHAGNHNTNWYSYNVS